MRVKSSLPAIRKITVRIMAKRVLAAGFAFGCLEEAVKGLDEAIGLTGLDPGDNTIEKARMARSPSR